MFIYVIKRRLPPVSKRSDTLVPYTTLVGAAGPADLPAEGRSAAARGPSSTEHLRTALSGHVRRGAGEQPPHRHDPALRRLHRRQGAKGLRDRLRRAHHVLHRDRKSVV